MTPPEPGRIIYSRGFPYGAPLVMLRGGATRDKGVQAFLRSKGLGWQASGRSSHAWEGYLHRDELHAVLVALRDDYGCEIYAKRGLDDNYVLQGFAKRAPSSKPKKTREVIR